MLVDPKYSRSPISRHFPARSLGLYWGWTIDVWVTDSFIWIVLSEVVVLVGVVAFRPRIQETGG